MHKVEPSKLQYLALQFAEKAAVFVENNERLLDSKTGGYLYNKEQGGKGQGQQGQDRRQDRGQWQDRRQGYGQYQHQHQQKSYGNKDQRDNRDNRGDQRDGRDNRDAKKDSFGSFQTARSHHRGDNYHRK